MKEQIVRPTQAGISTIIENPIGTLEKLGKYEFIYDYNANSNIFSEFPQNDLKPFGFDGDGTGLPSPIRGCFGNTSSNSSIARCGSIPPLVQNFPQPVKVNSEPQVGVFSKGNIVKVLRFDGNNAIIQNVHYKSTDPTIKKGFLSEYILNKKELSIPKDYLKKVDDNLAVTVSTGINYGANMKAQKTTFVNVPTDNLYVEPKPFLVIQDFVIQNIGMVGGSPTETIRKGQVVFLPTSINADQFDIALKGGKLQELPIVSVVSLVDKQMGKCNPSILQMQQTDYNPCRTVKKGETLIGYIANGVFTNTSTSAMKPQLFDGEYELTQTNSFLGIPIKNNNKNLLMIVGAFLVGYVLFANDKANK